MVKFDNVTPYYEEEQKYLDRVKEDLSALPNIDDGKGYSEYGAENPTKTGFEGW